MIHGQQFRAPFQQEQHQPESMYFKMFICIIVLEKYFIRIYALKWQCIAMDESVFSARIHIAVVTRAQSTVAMMFNIKKCMGTEKIVCAFFFDFCKSCQNNLLEDECCNNRIDVKICKHKCLVYEKWNKHWVLTVEQNPQTTSLTIVTMMGNTWVLQRKCSTNERRGQFEFSWYTPPERALVFSMFVISLSLPFSRFMCWILWRWYFNTPMSMLSAFAVAFYHCEFNLQFHL